MAGFKDKVGKLVPTASTDAFDRLRISTPFTLFDGKHLYGSNTIDGATDGTHEWHYIGSGGDASYSGSDSTVCLRTDLTSGSSVIKQSRLYYPYEPGKSQLIEATGIFGGGSQAVRQRVGLFDSNNGVYFVSDSGGQFGIGVRSDATGTVVDSVVYQSSWNNDVMDGKRGLHSGPNESGIILDQSKGYIAAMDFQWLGLGAVRFALVINGDINLCHVSNHSNLVTQPYMRTSTLPIRYEIENLTTLTTSAEHKTVCSTLMSEGGGKPAGNTFSVSNGVTLREGIGVREPVLAARLTDSFLGRDNRLAAEILNGSFYAEDQAVFFEAVLVMVPNSVEGTWTKVFSDVSGLEYSTDIASIDGGHEHQLLSEYVPAASKGNTTSPSIAGGEAKGIRDPFHFLTQNFDSTQSELFVVYATSIPGAAAKVSATITWEETQ